MFFSRRPLFFPLIGLILGISFLLFFRINFQFFFLLGSIFCLFFFIFKRYRFLLGLHVTVLFLFILVGWIIASLSLVKIQKESNLFQWNDQEKVYLIGKVSETCEKKEKGEMLILEVLTIRQSILANSALSPKEKIVTGSGKLLLKVGEGNCQFYPGDIVQTYTQVKKPDRFRNFGSFDYPFYLRTRGITASAFVENENYIVRLGEERNFLQTSVISFREKIKKDLEKVLDREDKAVLLALLLGSKDQLSSDLQKIFQKTGTTHLIVVSGLHLAMVGGFFYLLMRVFLSFYSPFLLEFPVRKISLIISFLFVTGYSLLVGFSPSVLRSFISATVVLFLLLCVRSKDLLSVFIFVIFAILLVSPLLLFNLSFQFSFFSVFSILILLPKLEGFFFNRFEKAFSKRISRYLLQIVLGSIVVQVGLFPILISNFHEFSWVSLFANLVLVPLFTFLLMPIGFLGIFSSCLNFSFVDFFFKLTASIFHPFLNFLKWLSSFVFSYSFFSGFNFFQFILFYSLILVWFLPFLLSRRFVIFIILFILNIFSFAWAPFFNHFDSSLRLSFFDVGQGDSLLMQLPNGKTILVDAGGSPQNSFDLGEQVLLPALFSKKITSLDYIVITHPHPDHFGGVKALLEPFHPKEIWWNGEKSELGSYQELLKEAERLKIPFKKLDQSVAPFEIEAVRFEVLYPPAGLVTANPLNGSEVNNHSLVLKVEYKNLSLLLAGDIQKETEDVLIASEKLNRIDLLKVPHHGSNTSSHFPLLCKIKPKIGLIGVGRKNWFKFPSSEVLSRYQLIGTQIFRTDEEGEIQLKWNGEKLRVKSFTGKQPQEVSLESPTLADANLRDVCR